MPDLNAVENAVQGMLDQEAVELVDLEYLHEGGRWVLRFYLDKPAGITVDDCEYLSRRIEGILDMTEIMSSSYVLEVSSPGLDRALKKEKDFLRFVGHRIKLRLKVAEEGRRNFSGFLKSCENGGIVLESGESALRVGLDRIEEARLVPEIEIGRKR